MAQRESSLAIDALVKKMIAEIQQHTIGDAANKLPPEPELMARYQVTRYTLRQALQKLSRMGYTFQAHGIGTFVRARLDRQAISMQNIVGMTDEVARQGRQLTTKFANLAQTTAAEAGFLPINSAIDANTTLWEVQRLRYADDEPFLYEQSYYLCEHVKEIPEQALYGSLFNFIENDDNLKLGFQDSTIAAGLMTADMATFFQKDEASPVLSVYDETYLSAGQLIAFSKLSYDADLTKLFMFKKL
ncbi:GntR family transcriptional regulator [Weissella paramesenteroides]|uniref:GntR family transcriptional regulator n=1 Tax=Weissella paramesenteroides TaxID=1249 RepID=UPI0023FA4913|nr:GntR family transcriptional regulator [Weissella paramesenteroides]MDF8372284.1 GntR family transcriptional regulator [Weissella paramesenteroides]WIG66071.1 GntR family transcriptional regulator [Weissella paramesenteroides]